jgi:hypothetical protein
MQVARLYPQVLQHHTRPNVHPIITRRVTLQTPGRAYCQQGWLSQLAPETSQPRCHGSPPQRRNHHGGRRPWTGMTE